MNYMPPPPDGVAPAPLPPPPMQQQTHPPFPTRPPGYFDAPARPVQPPPLPPGFRSEPRLPWWRTTLAIAGWVAVAFIVGVVAGHASGGPDHAATAAPTSTEPLRGAVTVPPPISPSTTRYVPPTTRYVPPTTEPVLTDREIQELALQMAWDDMTVSKQIDVCNAVDLFGYDFAAEQVVEGAGGGFDVDPVRAKLVEWC